tara:strand:- start:5720 stop:6907 length:1188 start_codon:yes stop_codon:yes gene_type:complete
MESFHSLSNKESKKIVGLMSGTSVDGVDASLVEVKGKGLETEVDLIAFDTFPFSADIRQRIFELFNPENSSVDKICQMNFLIGKIFAERAIQVIKSANLKPSDVDLIGSHGQTIYHLPPKEDAKYVPSTLQIGESAVIAYHTKIPVMADFRVADMAAGGQGAPLVSYVDFLLFRKPDKTIALQNLGGIANLTLIPANARADQVIASDTGPGNMIIDAVTEIVTNGRQQFDRDGHIASQGCIHPQLISKWMDHPFIKEVPPKTTGREDFGQQFAMQTIKDSKDYKLSNTDIVATVTEFTAQTIYHYYKTFLLPHYTIEKILVSGGGIHNHTLIKRISNLFGPISIEPAPFNDAKEAIAFAVLANEAIHGHKGNLPQVTGAKGPVILGKFVPAPPLI